ncbi:MAG: hypothetical protein HYS80_00095, partial [Candidatus Aenigmarchaeota archaeon]|nr:hypothetical protein [Candidatus Aenigmarchaeota archaeon]
MNQVKSGTTWSAVGVASFTKLSAAVSVDEDDDSTFSLETVGGVTGSLAFVQPAKNTIKAIAVI